MSLVCVGDINDKTQETLEKFFKDLPYEGLKKRDRSRSKRELPVENFKLQKSNFEKDHFYLSWPVEGFKDKKTEAYELLALLLGQGESSYLYKELKLKRGLCRSIGASYFGDAKDGIFVISGSTMGDEMEKLFSEIPSVLKSFFKQKDIKSDLDKARNIFDSESLYAEESIATQCRTIGDDWLYYDRFGATEERKDRILLLTEKHLVESSKDIFSKKPYLSVLSQKDVSENAKLLLSKIEGMKNLEVLFENTVLDQKSEDLSVKLTGGDQERFTWNTKKGNKVVFVRQPEGSVVSFKMAFQGGELLARDDQQGLVSLFGSMWGREFKNLSEQDFNEVMDFHCSGFSAFSGKHSVGLGLTTLRKSFEKLSGFFKKALTESEFSNEIFEREKHTLLHQLSSRKDRPSALAFKDFSNLIFKKSLYSRDSLGEPEDIKKLTTADLENFYRATKKQKCVYAIVGNLEKSDIEKIIEDIDDCLDTESADLFADNDKLDFPEGQTAEIKSDKNQSHIILGYPALTYNDPKKLRLDLVTSLLGGQGGRLFIELRDKASLAYSVAPIDYAGYFGGYFGGYIACDPTKKDLAVKMMKEELAKVKDVKITDDELSWMKNQVLGRQSMSLQKNSFICDSVLFDTLYGLESFSYRDLEHNLNHISALDLKETMTEILSGPEFLVIVG